MKTFNQTILSILCSLVISFSHASLDSSSQDLEKIDQLVALTPEKLHQQIHSLPQDLQNRLKDVVLRDYNQLYSALSQIPSVELKGHVTAVRDSAVNDDGRVAVGCSMDGKFHVWNLLTLEYKKIDVEGKAYHVAISPNGKYALVACVPPYRRTFYDVYLVNISTGAKTKLLDAQEGVTLLAFSPDSNYCVIKGHYSALRVDVWNTLDKSHKQLESPSRIDSCAFSPDSHALLTASDDKSVQLWNITTGKDYTLLNKQSKVVGPVTFAPNGLALIVSSNKVFLCNLANGQITIIANKEDVADVMITPDGKWIVIALWDQTVRLGNLINGQWQEMRYGTLDGRPFIVCKGKYVVTGLETSTLHVQHIPTLQSQEFKASSNIICFAFSAEGNCALTASGDKTLRLWKLPLLDTLTLEQLLLIIKLNKDKVDVDNVHVQQVLELTASHIDIQPLLPGDQYTTNALVKSYIDLKRTQLLKTAVAQDDIKTVIHLLKRGFGLNTCDKAGNTLWHYAFKGHVKDKCHYPSKKVLELLLTLEGSEGIKRKNKAGLPAFAEGLIAEKLLSNTTQFTTNFIQTYCKPQRSPCVIQ